jgi:nucleoside-diphosphate-sugar epimerase
MNAWPLQEFIKDTGRAWADPLPRHQRIQHKGTQMLTTPTGGHPATTRIHAGSRSKQLFLHAGTPPANAAAGRGKRILVTGSSGHLGEALVRTLRQGGADVVGLDFRPSDFTNVVGSVNDPDLMREVMAGVEVVFHAAALHKPQLAFLPGQAFLQTNICGTQTVLDAAVAANVRAFVMTSSTTVYGDALVPPAGQPAAWIDESVVPVPKNIYGVTKIGAEDLCQLAHRNHGLACVILRTSRFFADGDDMPGEYDGRSDDNVKANEYAFRRVALEDVVDAHLRAAARATHLGFGRYLVSATTPFTRQDMTGLRTDAATLFASVAPLAAQVWKERGWRFPDRLDRVYVNTRARHHLGWRPRFDLNAIAARVASGESVQTPLSQLVGAKEYVGSSYHLGVYHPTGSDGPVPLQRVHASVAG